MMTTESSVFSPTQERVGVYIDGLNVMFRLRESGWQEFFDVGHFARRVVGNRLLVQIGYFRVKPQMPPIKTAAQYWAEISYLQRVDKQLLADFGKYVRYGYMAKRRKG